MQHDLEAQLWWGVVGVWAVGGVGSGEQLALADFGSPGGCRTIRYNEAGLCITRQHLAEDMSRMKSRPHLIAKTSPSCRAASVRRKGDPF